MIKPPPDQGDQSQAGLIGERSRTVVALQARFAVPRPLSRPVPFWMINRPAGLTREEIRRQMGEFQRQGVRTLVVYWAHLEVVAVYLQEPWRRAMVEICEAARQAGLSLWIGDECMCPSGSLAMQIQEDPRYRSVGLQAHRVTVAPGGRLPELSGELLQVYRLGGSAPTPLPVDSWNNPAGGPDSVELLLVVVGDTPGRQGVIPLAQGFGRGEVNRLDDGAMAAFVERLHEEHARCLPEYLGSTLSGFFTDEPALFEPPGWCRDFSAEFAQRKGYHPLPHLAALFTDAGLATARFRCDFHEVLAALYRERYFDRQRAWCERHGLLYGGHLWENWPWGLAAGLLWQPDPLRTLAAMIVPGIDWTAGAGRVPVSELKMASSAARLAGRPRSLIEVYAGLGPTWSYEQLKWMWHWIAASGIDLMVLHTCYFAPDESPAGIAHPSIFWQTPLWRHFSCFAEYVGRLSELQQAGRPVVPVAVLYPTATVWAETVYPEGVWPKPPGHPLPPLPALERLRSQIEAVAAFLVEHQIDFDFIDEEALLSAAIEEDGLHHDAARYLAVVLPHTTTCRPETLERLSAFLRAGGQVVACGDLPVHSRGGETDDAEVHRSVARLHDAGLTVAGRDWLPLADALPRDLAVEPAADLGPERNLYYQRRTLDDGELFLLVSHSPQPEQWRVWLRAVGHPECWDPLDGTRHRLPAGRQAEGGTWLDLCFEPYQAYAVVFTAAPTEGLTNLPRPADPWTRIEGWWTVEFLANEGNPYLAPHDHRFDLRPRTLGPASGLVPWWRLGLGGFSGSARYRCTFTSPAAPAGQRCWLDLGRVEQTAEVTLNGQALGARLWRPFRFEVTGLLAAGENSLEVTVTNGLANFLAAPRGEEPPPLTQMAVSSMWSGLLGPVSLLVEANAMRGVHDSKREDS